jgi:hypothetical protein
MSARLPGGSLERNRSVSRTAPMSSERDQAGPPSAVPTTASADPPPTSQTATIVGRDDTPAKAPAKASRPSSSADRIRMEAPVAERSSRTRRSALALCRPGAVTSTSIVRAPSFLAIRAKPPAHRVASSMRTGESRPSRSTSSPRNRCSRSSRTVTSSPPCRRATRRRTVFEPTSMMPIFIARSFSRSRRLETPIWADGQRGAVHASAPCA